MELLQALKLRQSIREFNGEKAGEDEIKMILNAANLAPMTFINKDINISVISDLKLLRELDECGVKKFGEKLGVNSALYGAPTLILVSGKLSSSPLDWGVGEETFNRNLYWSMGSLIQNMHIMATSLGLGACPINTVVVALFDNPELAKKAGIPEQYSPLCSLAVGKTNHKFEPREPKTDHFHINFL